MSERTTRDKVLGLLETAGPTYMVNPYKMNLKRLAADAGVNYKTAWKYTRAQRKALRDALDKKVLDMRKARCSVDEIAKEVSLSKDTVYRLGRVARDKEYKAERAKRDKIMRSLKTIGF